MKPKNDLDYKMIPGTCRRYEVIEMHLFDKNDGEGEALCKDRVHVHDLFTVQYFMESRMYGITVGTVCERCKALAVPFPLNLSRDLEAEGLLDEAEEYRQLAYKLARETASERGPG